MLSRSSLRLALSSLVLAFSPIAHAGISSIGGAVVIVASPPADISSNHWESNTQIRAFVEQTNLVLPQDVADDISVPGTSPSATDANLSPSKIPAGTAVNSYMLHFDVNGQRATDNALEETGSVFFTEPVIGLIALSDTLNASNSIFALPGIIYSAGTDHGLDFDPAGGGTSDIVTLTGDRLGVNVDLRNSSFADDLRIVTAAPEPSTMSLLAIVTMIGLSRQRMMRAGYGPNRRACIFG
jgi:hypothetical protein